MTSHENLSSASKAFGKIATEQKNPAAAAMAIHLAIASAEAYAAELEERQRQAKDGFNKPLTIGDTLFLAGPGIMEGVTVSPENIDELSKAYAIERIMPSEGSHDCYRIRLIQPVTA